MLSHPAVLLASLLTHAPMLSLPDGAKLKQCYSFEIEQTVSIRGKTKTKREVCFTPAELPWADVGIRVRTNLEEGFDLKKTAVAIKFGGKKVQGKKLTWRRNPKHTANVSASAIHCWVLSEIHIPSFKPVALGPRLEFHLPPGCVKVKVVPHAENANGISKFERQTAMAATGEYKKSTKFKLGKRQLDAHEMVFRIASKEHKRAITYTVSHEMPGAICSLTIDGKVSGTIRVQKMIPVAPPRNLDRFPKKGFAFAPPAGYVKSKAPKKGEVVRYVKGADFIAVTIVPLSKRGLLALQQEIGYEGTGKYGLRVVGSSRNRHLAGHKSFDAQHTQSKTPVIITQHAGRGYLLSASALDRLTPVQTREFLKGWRWIVTAGGK